MGLIPVLMKREFTSRVKGTAYIITTLIGIFVFVALAFLPALMERFATTLGPGKIELVVVENPGEASILPYLQQLSTEQDNLVIRDATALDDVEAYRMVLDQGLSGLLLIDGPLYTLVTPDSKNVVLNDEVKNIVSQAVTWRTAVSLELSQDELLSLFQPIDFRVREVSPHSESGVEIDSAAHTQAMVLAYFLLFMIYTALIMYGNMVATGVAEEKSSRIMEVMVSTVKPMELMFGKIIGVGALGLLQFVLWISTGLVMSAIGKTGILARVLGSSESLGAVSLSAVLWFGLYFLLGYFFYASIFAAAGALVSRVEEVNQVVTLLMMFIIVGFLAAYVSFLNPNGTLAVATSLIPFTAPMVMFARIVLASPPLIEVIASILIMLVSIILGTWFSAKIYRIGILLYGKRPSVRQVFRLLRD